jgi:hypothetical protein
MGQFWRIQAMSWICQCASAQPDDARFCDRCGQPKQPSPVQGTNALSSDVLKLVAIVAVLLVGCIFGTVVAATSFRSRGNETSAQTSSPPDSRSTFQQTFDASFKASCQHSAMIAGRISRSSAENYCDCALPIFKQTHDMSKAAASCKQYVFR